MDDDITYDPDTDSYVVDVSLDRPDAAADAVVATVTAVRGDDPTALPPLANVVDTDALGELFSSGSERSSNVRASFDYAGFRVTVSEPGEVRLVED